jgi:iron-sulfur cluster insertion protein
MEIVEVVTRCDDAAALEQLDMSELVATPGVEKTIDSMFIVTENAARKVSELLAAEDADGMRLRVAVRPGGCSGFSYEMFFDADTAEGDTVEVQYGVPVVIDAASAQLLERATLDYRDTLDKAGFHIDNPSAKRTCGCGQSFS